MDGTGSCIHERDSISLSPPNNIPPNLPSPVIITKSPDPSHCRVGSTGNSVVLDSETGVEAESRKLPSSKYKGVVPQPNGRWGAQIYEKHQRVWLGTFNEEDEAAKAYDIAAQRYRGRDAITNFKRQSHQEEEEEEDNDDDVIETAFLNSHSKAEIVDMLRKHTYNDELEQSRRSYGGDGGNGNGNGKRGVVIRNDVVGELKAREQLFEKSVTPSDVGKLNRLVIPKMHAEKYFPLRNGIMGNSSSSSSSKGLLLNLEDVVSGKVWRFRYSYWNSSQSYVLTKGWSRFVKEKKLKAGDIVSFQRSKGPEKQLYIDWKVRTRSTDSGLVNRVGPVQMVRLFGVNIFNIPATGSGNVGCNGKRTREMEMFELVCSKKQRVIDAL